MSYTTRYRVNGSRVIQEHFDNEVIVVNLDSGRYYCLQQIGADVWPQIVSGLSAEDIASTLAIEYDATHATIAQAIDNLCQELVREALIVPDGALPQALQAPPHVPHTDDASATRKAFVAPALQVYTDMQDLLLLDPIHEVDPAGWPAVRREEPGQPQ